MEHEIQPEEDFRLCGERIFNILKEGNEISDDVYVDLFVAKLRMTYEHKSKKQLRYELRQKVIKERDLGKKYQAVTDEALEWYKNGDEGG